MKIGPVDVTIPMMVYAGGFVFAIVFLIGMWSKNSEIRSEAMARDKILRAMREDSGENTESAIQSCRSLVEQRPERMNARLFLGDLLFKQKQFKEAQKVYEEAAGVSTAKPEEKGWAWVGAGVSLFSSASKEAQAKVAVEAAKLFQKALAEDAKCADALVNLAVVRLYEGGPNAASEAEKFCTQARELTTVPSLKSLEQLYAVSGMISAQLNKPAEAVAMLDKARAIRPSWKGAEEMRRTASLATVVQPEMDVKERRKILELLDSQVSKFGKEQDTAYNAIGIGWSYFKGTPEFNSGPYAASHRAFIKAIDFNSKDSRAYLNLSALLDDQILATAAKMSVPVTGFTGETPAPSRWKDAEKKTRFGLTDKTIYMEIRRLLKEQEELLKKFVEKSGATPELKMRAKIKMAATIRRNVYLLEFEEENQRPSILGKATQIIKELLTAFPESPDVHLASAYLLFEKEEYLNAYNAFVTAQSKGAKSAEIDNIIAVLGAKPEILDSRPREDRRIYGTRPLVAASLKAMTGGGPLKKVTMRLGVKDVPADKISIYGSQVLYLPLDGDLPDGQNDVVVSVTDALNQSVEFPPFKFSVDKQKPSWSVTPENGATVTTKPQFNVTISDRSGIDFNTLKITWKPLDGKKNTAIKEFIKDGRVKISMNDLNPPRKIGFPIDNETFQVSPGGLEVNAGEYELFISVMDMAGNLLEDTKKYTVK